jgi:hypothetical protein
VVFSRKKSEPVADAGPAPTTTRVGKGHPTPKRRDSEAARRRPLVADTRGASREDKAKRKVARAKSRQAMMRGDEAYLGPRDKGPVKRYLRDIVDSRWNIGEILLPTMLLILVGSLINVPGVQIAMFAAAYGLILFGLVDSIVLWKRTKAKIPQIFGEEPPRGSASYVVLRAFQMRRSRIPRPALERGDEPRRR